uniref:Homoserine dehydrogenase n=1 Tax=Grammatophora oceanica TaxID=210454 RepID=A0A7S1UNP3_9STRA
MSSASKKANLMVAVIGYTGGVGTCLLKAMKTISLEPVCLVRSTTMKFTSGDQKEIPVDYSLLAKHLLKEEKHGIPVIADVTASAVVQTHYKGWLEQGISVVTANKGIFASAEYPSLLKAAAVGKARLLHETTVGAGLPVLSTLAALKASSHKILKVEGILSGTLAYVLGQVASNKTSLSEAVLKAKELGYTEPDPRDDLNGMDVARKAVILARVAGMESEDAVNLEKMTIESLVPEPLRDCSVEEFLSKLSEHGDEAMKEKVTAVESSSDGARLHYAAKVDVVNQTVQVGLLECEASHPFNNAGPDNMVAITTNFYKDRPLVVQGAGAGGDVTATGVLADILQCAYQ